MPSPLDRATIVALWNASWEQGHGYAPWKDVLASLTVPTAVWRPQPGRLSIWAHVSHLSFWHGHFVATVEGRPLPSSETIRRTQFASPGSDPAVGEPIEPTAAAWDAARSNLVRSHAAVAVALADPRADLDHWGGLVAHDAYHLGQIMLLRALQGLPPMV